ncbi:MAG: NAD-dependent epimerase/dehydratase family protein [Spirochaetaceae bacterium]|jgi:nucleoside-diphosphate-sugar epimerase|nr:NAD-dependent epimerase/dehydratase family protein [Spirochaetaceae bacterium]
MNLTLLGGSGFVGTRLTARLLNAGHRVRILDKNNSKSYFELHTFADVREPETLEQALVDANGEKPDAVINLAAEHRDDVSPKSLYDEVNVGGAENLCKVCRKLGIHKIIFTSSVAVYGFAPLGTDESGQVNYFNDYGRTKWLAERKYREWLQTDTANSLTIIRPTVIFGEQNRGNVYNLLKQIAGGHFPIVGKGTNIKSMAYVENVAAFIEYNLNNTPGEHLFNYIDKPDFDMNHLVAEVDRIFGRHVPKIHWPYWLGLLGGYGFDLLAFILHKKLTISSIRVKKFCANSMFEANALKQTGFKAPVSLNEALEKTIRYEFIDKVKGNYFYSE